MRFVPLSKGKSATVDDEDYNVISTFKWTYMRAGQKEENGYAYTTIDGKTIYMHRMIMKAKKGMEIDHVDSNGLNNQKDNLRFCTKSQNNANRKPKTNNSGYIGVYQKRNKWCAEIGGHEFRLRVGLFDTPEEAAVARDAAALKRYGSFAVLNQGLN